jgi:predicted phosphodiesterase
MRLVLVTIVCVSTTFYGCKKTFEYSPYSAETDKTYTELRTEKNLERIAAGKVETGRFKVAFLSDTHYFHDELSNAIDLINADNNIMFVVVCGDLSDQGMQKEYTYFYEQATRLNKPILTVIGNHDYLANAEDIYASMFGPNNYTLDYHGYRFIFFDNVFWEKNATPDFDWFNTQAASAVAENKKPILISHIPFFGDQYDSTSAAKHLDILRNNQVALSVHGHQHTYSYTDVGDGKCLVVPSIGKQSFCTVSFDAAVKDPVVTTVNFQ